MKKGYMYIILTAFAFSTMETIGKLASSQVNPFQLTFLRFFIGSLLLLPFALKDLKQKNIKLNIKDFLFFALTGILGIVISMSCFQLALLYTKASTVAIIFSTNAIFTVPLAYFILKEPLHKSITFSLVLSLLGILCFVAPNAFGVDLIGILLIILSAITFSLYSVICKTRVNKYGPLSLNCFSFLCGDLMLLICILPFDIPILRGINFSNMFYILYLGIFVTGLGYLFYFLAIKETSAITASIAFLIKPALAPILSLIILGEVINWNTLLGIMCILIAAYFMLYSNKKDTK